MPSSDSYPMKPVRLRWDQEWFEGRLNAHEEAFNRMWDILEEKNMPSTKQPQIDKAQWYESSNVWILPSGLAINRSRIMFVSPPTDPSGKEIEEMVVFLEVGDQCVSLKIEHPKDRTALRQAILALGVEIG